MSDTPPSPKKAFPLRISPRLFEQLRVWADEELRSINGQIEYLLADAVRRRGRQKPGASSGGNAGFLTSPEGDGESKNRD